MIKVMFLEFSGRLGEKQCYFDFKSERAEGLKDD